MNKIKNRMRSDTLTGSLFMKENEAEGIVKETFYNCCKIPIFIFRDPKEV